MLQHHHQHSSRYGAMAGSEHVLVGPQHMTQPIYVYAVRTAHASIYNTGAAGARYGVRAAARMVSARCARRVQHIYVLVSFILGRVLCAGPYHRPVPAPVLMLLTEHDECCLTWLNQQFLH